MKNLRTSRLLAMFMCIAMMFTLLPLGLSADDTAVAKIGETEYATLDEAIAAAVDGDTIVLLQDCTATKTFYKSLTFTGGHTVSMDFYGWRYNGDLTFDGATLIINSDSNSPVANNGEAGRWFTMVLGGSITAKNKANITFMFDSDSGTNCAIYAGPGGVTINVDNKSTFSIYGKNTKGVAGQGIQLDSTADTGIFVTGDSKFLIDGTNRGYVNSPTIYVDNSTFTVQNCTSNASNGGTFTAIKSRINFLNNAGHGLSATVLTISDESVLNCNNNAYYGVTVGSKITMDGTSSLTSNENGWGFTGGALRLQKSETNGSFASGATIILKNNVRNALENYGNCTFESNAILEITGNYEPNNGAGIFNKGNIALPENAVIMYNTANASGGGICNKGSGNVTIPGSVKLYNNHAGVSGDDIYCEASTEAASAITFGDVGSNWILDDCTPNHLIDGWYEDGNNQNGTRWTAHADNEEDNYIVEVESGSFVNQLFALKAAHGVDAVDPNDSEPEEPDIPIIIINFVNTIIQKIDSENGAPLAGAEFALYKSLNDTKPFRTGTTDENGQITFERLNENTTYYLIETKAPEGYVPNTTVYELTTGRFSDRTPSLIIENDKTEVPPVLESGDHFAYIVGYPDGNVRPIGNITRAEVATIFFRLLTEEVRNENMTWDNPFSDVNVGDWYDCAISTLYAMGIINGYPDGTYNPNGFITRAEFAAIAARFDTIGNDFEESFGDVYGHWAEDEIAAAKAHGWLTGYEDGTFKPDQLITRAEAMTIVNRVLNRIPASADALLDDMVKWPDNADIDEWYYLAVQEATNSHFYERTDDNKEVWTEIREPRDWTELEK